jgi:hypothetical protein
LSLLSWSSLDIGVVARGLQRNSKQQIVNSKQQRQAVACKMQEAAPSSIVSLKPGQGDKQTDTALHVFARSMRVCDRLT